MKRVKLMLLSLLVLGVVGGAMAFKARFSASYCTTPVRIITTNGQHVCTAVGGAALTCPNPIAAVTTAGATQFNSWCYTTTNNDADCNPAPNCRVTRQGLDDNGAE